MCVPYAVVDGKEELTLVVINCVRHGQKSEDRSEIGGSRVVPKKLRALPYDDRLLHSYR
jgi:hypothetical protein